MSQNRDIALIELDNHVKALANDYALKSAVAGFGVVGAATAYMSSTSFFFQKRLSPSAKASFPIMAALFCGSLSWELTGYYAKLNPDRWGLAVPKDVIPQKYMPLHHRVANYASDHPFALMFGLGVPIVGKIFHYQNQFSHLTLPQKIMKSRVIGQFSMLTLIVTTLGFHFYMEKNGKFPDPRAEELAADQNKFIRH